MYYIYIYIYHIGVCLMTLQVKLLPKRSRNQRIQKAMGDLGKRDAKKEFRNPDELRYPLPTLAWWRSWCSQCMSGWIQDIECQSKDSSTFFSVS